VDFGSASYYIFVDPSRHLEQGRLSEGPGAVHPRQQVLNNGLCPEWPGKWTVDNGSAEMGVLHDSLLLVFVSRLRLSSLLVS
jgi:hypothetical protein